MSKNIIYNNVEVSPEKPEINRRLTAIDNPEFNKRSRREIDMERSKIEIELNKKLGTNNEYQMLIKTPHRDLVRQYLELKNQLNEKTEHIRQFLIRIGNLRDCIKKLNPNVDFEKIETKHIN